MKRILKAFKMVYSKFDKPELNFEFVWLGWLLKEKLFFLKKLKGT